MQYLTDTALLVVLIQNSSTSDVVRPTVLCTVSIRTKLECHLMGADLAFVSNIPTGVASGYNSVPPGNDPILSKKKVLLDHIWICVVCVSRERRES